MTDTIEWDGVTVPFRVFPHDEPRLLGDILQMSAEVLHSKRMARVAIYEINDLRYLTVSGGKPFIAATYELRTDAGKPLPQALPGVAETHILPVFKAENTGDGITFIFDKTDSHRPLTKIVTEAVRESARRYNP